jgi:DNA adenine methylase
MEKDIISKVPFSRTSSSGSLSRFGDESHILSNTVFDSLSQKVLHPFIKWVGGKSKYINDISSFIPKTYDRYYEPFVGGGALFLHLKPKKAYISDMNIELINCYQVIRSDITALMKELDTYTTKNIDTIYYEQRDIYNQMKKEHTYSYDDVSSYPNFCELQKICVQKAGLFIYLNKTGFRGLYRENNSGMMNVPYGNYKTVKLYERENLSNINKYLVSNDIIIKHHSYNQISPTVDDFVYLDPPYDQEKKSDFVSYTSDGFKQSELFHFIQSLCKINKTKCVLSNAPTKNIKLLYKDYPQKILCGKRNVDVKKIKTVKDIEIIISCNLALSETS